MKREEDEHFYNLNCIIFTGKRSAAQLEGERSLVASIEREISAHNPQWVNDFINRKYVNSFIISLLVHSLMKMRFFPK